MFSWRVPVETSEASEILLMLAKGLQPDTGSPFPPQSPYCSDAVKSALDRALRLVESANPQAVKTVAALSSAQQARYNRLKAWRFDTARSENLPAFTIAHDRMLIEMAQRRFDSLSDLARIKGFGMGRAQKYGEAILFILNGSDTNPGATQKEGVADSTGHTEPGNTLSAARARYPEAALRHLLITEVTRMQNEYYCIAAFDLHAGRMARPLRLGGAYWKFDEFQERYFPGDLLAAPTGGTPEGLLPHRNENLILSGVMRRLERWSPSELYHAMLPEAVESVQKLFGRRLEEDRYLIEGTNTPSLGGVRIARRRIGFCVNSSNRLRLQIEDTDRLVYTISVTCDRLRTLFDPERDGRAADRANRLLEVILADEQVVLRIGLSRGYAGEHGEFDPKRCYLQINGLLSGVNWLPDATGLV